jgi:hypothetical protein
MDNEKKKQTANAKIGRVSMRDILTSIMFVIDLDKKKNHFADITK